MNKVADHLTNPFLAKARTEICGAEDIVSAVFLLFFLHPHYFNSTTLSVRCEAPVAIRDYFLTESD